MINWKAVLLILLIGNIVAAVPHGFLDIVQQVHTAEGLSTPFWILPARLVVNFLVLTVMIYLVSTVDSSRAIANALLLLSLAVLVTCLVRLYQSAFLFPGTIIIELLYGIPATALGFFVSKMQAPSATDEVSQL